MPFTFSRLEVPEVVVVQPQVFRDERGLFAELFTTSDFQAAGLPSSFPQCNRSVSAKRVLRGLHYQLL